MRYRAGLRFINNNTKQYSRLSIVKQYASAFRHQLQGLVWCIMSWGIMSGEIVYTLRETYCALSKLINDQQLTDKKCETDALIDGCVVLRQIVVQFALVLVGLVLAIETHRGC